MELQTLEHIGSSCGTTYRRKFIPALSLYLAPESEDLKEMHESECWL